jgi:hypothetical protein
VAFFTDFLLLIVIQAVPDTIAAIQQQPAAQHVSGAKSLLQSIVSFLYKCGAATFNRAFV